MTWPPEGIPPNWGFSQEEIELLVGSGALVFAGTTLVASRGGIRHIVAYVDVVGGENATVYVEMAPSFSYTLGRGHSWPHLLAVPGVAPWRTLEQPSMVAGGLAPPGAVTMNGWVSKAIKNEEKALSRPCTNTGNPGVDGVLQLVTKLNSCGYMDFSILRNQVLGNFPPEIGDLDPALKNQLDLSAQILYGLDALPDDNVKSDILWELPKPVAWSIALVDLRRHRTHGRFEQKALLGNFATTMRWPGYESLCTRLLSSNDGISDEDMCPEARTWFSGLVLPGPIGSWLLMIALTKLTPDTALLLSNLKQLEPDMGFQHAGCSYHYRDNIVGKVFGAMKGAVENSGWVVFPKVSKDARMTSTCLVRVFSMKVSETIEPWQVDGMARHTRPIGHIIASNQVKRGYMVEDYHEVELTTNEAYPSPDAVQLQDFLFRTGIFKDRLYSPPGTAPFYPASITFSVQNRQYFSGLRYNVTFIAAPTCGNNRPHMLYFGYPYQNIVATDLPMLKHWPHISAPIGARGPTTNTNDDEYSQMSKNSSGSDSSNSPCSSNDPLIISTLWDIPSDRRDSPSKFNGKLPFELPTNNKTVLLIEAHGSHDACILARSWCSDKGLSAIVADAQDTCPACAIRMAHAVSFGVVILSDNKARAEREGMDEEDPILVAQEEARVEEERKEREQQKKNEKLKEQHKEMEEKKEREHREFMEKCEKLKEQYLQSVADELRGNGGRSEKTAYEERIAREEQEKKRRLAEQMQRQQAEEQSASMRNGQGQTQARRPCQQPCKACDEEASSRARGQQENNRKFAEDTQRRQAEQQRAATQNRQAQKPAQGPCQNPYKACDAEASERDRKEADARAARAEAESMLHADLDTFMAYFFPNPRDTKQATGMPQTGGPAGSPESQTTSYSDDSDEEEEDEPEITTSPVEIEFILNERERGFWMSEVGIDVMDFEETTGYEGLSPDEIMEAERWFNYNERKSWSVDEWERARVLQERLQLRGHVRFSRENEIFEIPAREPKVKEWKK